MSIMRHFVYVCFIPTICCYNIQGCTPMQASHLSATSSAFFRCKNFTFLCLASWLHYRVNFRAIECLIKPTLTRISHYSDLMEQKHKERCGMQIHGDRGTETKYMTAEHGQWTFDAPIQNSVRKRPKKSKMF